jgi:putative FmdB family regulatory protein
MALYEYQCARCGRKTEVIQRFSDPPPEKCPHCGGKLAKLLSSPAFQFKGSGFYSTDYGKSGAKKEDSSKEKDGESSKEKEGDSSKGKETDAGAASEAKGASAGDSSKEKKDSGDSSKERRDAGPGAASDGAAAKTSNAPSSPSRKSSRRK